MRRIAWLLGPLFLLACDRGPVAPDSAPTLDVASAASACLPTGLTTASTSLTAMSAPLEAGIITRGETTEGWFVQDFKSDMEVVFGFDPVALCSGSPDLEFDVIPYQSASLPDGRQTLRENGMVRVSVWGFCTFSCQRFLGEQPLATGEAMLRSTDNNLTPWLSDSPSANAWGYMINGQLTTLSGERAILAAHWRQNGHPGDWHVTSSVRLH